MFYMQLVCVPTVAFSKHFMNANTRLKMDGYTQDLRQVKALNHIYNKR